MLMACALLLVACGCKEKRTGIAGTEKTVLTFFTESEKERVLSHLHYSLDIGTIDHIRGTVELSFCFTRLQGDSLLWVECVERVPLELIDTALCHRWLDYDYAVGTPYAHF